MWLEAKDSALSQSLTSKPFLPWSLRLDIWSTELRLPTAYLPEAASLLCQALELDTGVCYGA